MGFYMRRYRGTSGVSQVENEGGTFTMGYVSDSSAHTCVLGAIVVREELLRELYRMIARQGDPRRFWDEDVARRIMWEHD